MKMILSTPSTISSIARVASAIHASGVVKICKNSIMLSINWLMKDAFFTSHSCHRSLPAACCGKTVGSPHSLDRNKPTPTSRLLAFHESLHLADEETLTQ